MKKKYLLSGLIGGAFFSVAYLPLSLGVVPSLLTSIVAFGASSLIFKDDEIKLDDLSEYKKLLNDSINNLNKLKKMYSKLDDPKIKLKVENITKITEKIFKVLNKYPEKTMSASKFLNYYLPITIKILEKYDEIDDQSLTSKSSIELLERIRLLIVNIELAFENSLNNLYNEDVIDTSAEIKVFETMLKTDGLLDVDIYKKDGEKNEK